SAELAPHCVGVVGTVAPGRPLALGGGLASPTALFSRRMQDAVEGRFRGQISLLIVQQPRDDLRRRQAGKLRAVADIQHCLTFLRRQGMGRRGPAGMGALVFTPTGPAPVGVLPNTQFSTNSAQAVIPPQNRSDQK